MCQTDDTELHGLDLRIRALTFILHKLAPQAAHPTKTPKTRDQHLVAATNIATVLTRGVAHSKSGAVRFGPSIRPIAVTAHISSKSVNIYASEEDYVFAQNPLPKAESPAITIELEPSSGTVSEIINRDPDAPPGKIDLNQHASDILGIINGFAQTPRDLYNTTSFEIQTFITRRCAPIISHRIKSDKFVFGATSFLDIIQDWQPTEHDTLELAHDVEEFPGYFKVDEELAVVAEESLGITFEARGDKFYCQGTMEIAALWVRLLHGLLSDSKEFFDLPLLKKGRPNAEFIDATQDLTLLSSLLRMRGFRDILEIPSLDARLASAIRTHQRNTSARPNVTDHAPHDAESTDLAELGNTVDPEQAELSAEDGEPPASLTLRYLGNIVAWMNATNALIRSKLVGENAVPLRLRLMTLPPPWRPDAMDNVWDIFRTAAGKIEPDPSDIDSFESWRDAWMHKLTASPSATVSTSQPPNPTFSGTIHCEAALMDAIANNELENLGSTPRQFRAVGVAKKCCWCCTELGRIIGEKHGSKFLLPGSHGQIFEWALPKGVSLEVARALMESLDAKLMEAVVHDFTHRWRLPVSQTSSPTLSVGTLVHGGPFNMQGGVKKRNKSTGKRLKPS